MRFHEAELAGVFVVEPEPQRDERGFFARIYCPEEFLAAGIKFSPAQINLSRNVSRHTLRGLHFQDPPHAEAKLVYVTRGAVYDVVVDLRRDSATFGRWTAFNLGADEARVLYVPEGCAHGFLTLEPNTDVFYQMSRLHVPGRTKGYRWNDPAFRIEWPAFPESVSAADESWPDFSREANSGSNV